MHLHLKRYRLFSTLSVLLLAAALVLAVPGFRTERAAAQDGAQTGNAFVRFAHLSPDTAAADVYVNDALSDAENLSFGTFSDWMAVPAGSHDIGVTPSGEDLANAVIEPASYNLAPGQWVTVAVVGSADDGTLAASVVEEDHSPMLPGTARMTFFNGLLQEPMNFVRDDEEFVTQLGSVNNAEGLNTSTSIPMDVATYDFYAHPTAEPTNVLAELENTELEATNTYFMTVVEGPDGPTLILEPTRWATTQMLLGNLAEPGTLVQAIAGQPLLTQFDQAVEQAGLADTLNDETTHYTIFAPFDDAMEAVLPQYADDSEGLATYLRDHIVEGDLKFNELTEMDSITALSGKTLPLRVEDNTVYVNDVAIVTPNVAAMNGTVHIIGLAPGQE